jgi:hypothetical protein
MIIHLNEHRFGRLFLTESKNSRRAKRQTREILAQAYEMSVDDQEIADMEETFEKQNFGEGLRQDWFIVLEPYACKWWLEGNVFSKNIGRLLQVIYSKAQISQNRSEFINYVKGFKSFEELRNFVGELERQDRIDARKNKVKPQLNPNYKVLGPLSFDEAKQYGNYSGYGGGQSGRVCYTQYPNTWLSSNYSNNNRNYCYLLLRNDWKNVAPQHDGSEVNNGLEGLNMNLNRGNSYYSGYDNYGLSMIFVWITPEGSLYKSNTRWNHEANYAPGHGVDNPFSEKDIEHLIGASFEDIFNLESFYNKADTAYEGFMNGKPIDEVFDNVETINDSFAIVVLNGRYNIFSLTNNKLLYPHDWFDRIEEANKYGDLEVNDGINTYYLNADDGKLLYSDKLIEVIGDRLSQGASIDMFFDEDYRVINMLGDWVIHNGIAKYNKKRKRRRNLRSNLYFNGKTLTDIYGYFDVILKRLKHGYDFEKNFSKVEKSPLGYALVYIDDDGFVFANGDFKYDVEGFDSSRIFNKLGHAVLGYNNESMYFDGTNTYEINEYLELVQKLIKSGADLKEIFTDVKIDNRIPNYPLVSIPAYVEAEKYMLFDLENGKFAFDFYCDKINIIDNEHFRGDGLERLLSKVLWVRLENGDEYSGTEKHYAPFINGKLCLYNGTKLFDEVGTWTIRVGYACGFLVRIEEFYYNILGEMEDGSIGFAFNSENIEELPYEIITSDVSDEYALARFEDDTEMLMIPCWKLVSNEEFVQYVNESLSDGEYLSAFGEWEDLSDSFGSIQFIDGGYNVVDKRSRENRLMLSRNTYGTVRVFKDEFHPNQILIGGFYDGERRYNIMKEDGTLLIDTENTEMWPAKIIPTNSRKRKLYIIEMPYHAQYEDGGANIIDENGNRLFEKYFYVINSFYNGVCVAQDERRFNFFIDEDGNILNEDNPIYMYSRNDFTSPSLSIPVRCEFVGKEGYYLFSKTDHKFYKAK